MVSEINPVYNAFANGRYLPLTVEEILLNREDSEGYS